MFVVYDEWDNSIKSFETNFEVDRWQRYSIHTSLNRSRNVLLNPLFRDSESMAAHKRR